MKNYAVSRYLKKNKDDASSEKDEELPKCLECGISFDSKYLLYEHLLNHIKQPVVILEHYKVPLKITLKNKNNSFEIVSSPQKISSPLSSSTNSTTDYLANLAEDTEANIENSVEEGADEEVEEANVTFSPNYVVETNDVDSPAITSENSNSSMNFQADMLDPLTEDPSADASSMGENLSSQEYGRIPGAEPTPPPEPSPEYPKIRIKTTGLLKEPLTITEITDDNSNGNLNRPEMVEVGPNGESSCSSGYSSNQGEVSNLWTTPSLEDPLRLPDVGDKDDGNLMSLFSNDNERAKDLGFTTSESEFISLDRLDDRNRNALQVYNSHAITSTQNPLDSLTGLPMQQLAQQVSRLQPGNGMHQQNVLINIQQFPQAPPQPPHGYQPPSSMYHHPPHSNQPPMYQPYQYQPPNHMYYPPAPPTYSHMPPPPPQIGQPPQQQMSPQQPMPQQYRPPPAPRHPTGLRQTAPVPRAAVGSSPRHPLTPRQPMQVRQRAPMPRPRGGMVGVRAPMRPRMQGPHNVTPMQSQNNQQRPVKRTPEQIQALQGKRKKMDILMPDKNDDPDCQVICTQPKNMDGGLPQIQSVQGGTPDLADGNVMHLSDSITLSVRNPPPVSQSPKKSDAKAVANILATRGITVTATAKAKEKCESPRKSASPTPAPAPVAINLNNAVSIIPAAKTNGKPSTSDTRLPTVDLTDDTVPESRQTPPKSNIVQKPNQRGGLPFRCDLCPAQYPNSVSLNKHKQTYHKTGGPCQVGVPLVNLKQAGVIQKLSSLGIFNYIPLPGAGSDGNFGIPVINARNPGNVAAIGATSVLTLGPIRSIPRPNINNNAGK